MNPKHKIRSGFRVIGPNTANFQESSWHFDTLKQARNFCEHIASEVDAEYDIFQFVGTVRQIPKPTRPLEWVPTKASPRK